MKASISGHERNGSDSQRTPLVQKDHVAIAMPRVRDPRALPEPAAPGPTGEEHDRVGLRVRCGRPPRGDGESDGPATRPRPVLGDGEVPARVLGTQNDAGVDGVGTRRLSIRRQCAAVVAAVVAA